MKRQVINHTRSTSLYFVVFLVLISMFCKCNLTENQTEEETEYKNELSEKLYSIRNEDSLITILQEFSKEKNDFGKMICYKNIGSLQRASGRFSDAISSHKQGLNIALELNDTIEIVQAMNNMGINLQRIGANSEASQYYCQALHYVETWSKLDTPIGIKNHMTTLSGIGNISRKLGYYRDAEKSFREIMKYKTTQDNQQEHAINYANLGGVYKIYQQYDSAYIYYQKSMELYKTTKSDKSIALCLIDIGKLYEKERKYELAKTEYLKAYKLIDRTSNKCNWLQACISLARIYLTTGNISEFNNYIQLAESTANEIKSIEDLADIYKLKYDYSLRQGDHQLALQHFTQHIALQDSVQGAQKGTEYMEIRLGYEQDKTSLHLQQMEAVSEMKQQKKDFAVYVAWLITILSFIILAALYYAYRLRTRSNIILKKLESARSDFFTKITHELRTPLTVILGLNQYMQQKKDFSEKEKVFFRDAIERQSNTILDLVNLLLDIAKLKQGSDNPKWKRGDIVAYLQMAAETFRIYAKEKGVNLLFYSDIDSLEMDFVPSYIDKIINNLISNAIKHTDSGGKIDFIVGNGQRPDTMNIRIADTGGGISEEDIELIFDFFYQSSQSRNSSGTGIGLAFTKMMIEKMKGKIEVESQLEQGSVFTVILPLTNKKLPHIPSLKEYDKPVVALPKIEYATTLYEENQDTLDEDTNHGQPLVLIVEDNQDVVLYLKSILINNYRIITAWNGEEGLNAAKENIPDLVITDIMMPVKDGYQLVDEMKHNILLNHIPVIMLTAKITDEDRIKGLRYGIERYISKPFQWEELILHIENIFETRRLLREKYMSAIITTGSQSKLRNDENMKLLQTITNYIYAEINNPELNATFLADKMAMSVSQLSRKINGITGFSTISYVLQIKLNKAKKMLSNEDISITEVADACGFYDPNYFSRVFKKEFGVTPSNFQKMPNLI